MTFSHKVKHNGVYYPIGANVPIDSGGVTAPAVDVLGKVEQKYSENQLDVPIQKLRKMAKENGIKLTNKDNAEVLRNKLRAL